MLAYEEVIDKAEGKPGSFGAGSGASRVQRFGRRFLLTFDIRSSYTSAYCCHVDTCLLLGLRLIAVQALVYKR
jgi:hypothetical protein